MYTSWILQHKKKPRKFSDGYGEQIRFSFICQLRRSCAAATRIAAEVSLGLRATPRSRRADSGLSLTSSYICCLWRKQSSVAAQLTCRQMEIRDYSCAKPSSTVSPWTSLLDLSSVPCQGLVNSSEQFKLRSYGRCDFFLTGQTSLTGC